MSNEKPASERKKWAAPELKVLGTVVDITTQQNKTTGPSDGYLFQGVPIMNVS